MEKNATHRHMPVLLKEAVDALAVKEGGRYVDGTLGRAGHAREVIARGGTVLGIDRDDEALAEVAALAEGTDWGKRLIAVKGDHGGLAEIARRKGWDDGIDGVLLDLGVSSPQLDEAGRGFSFLRDGPLDMRMDRRGGLTAADLVNGESAERLEEIFREKGGERFARRIARAVVAERGPRPFSTTLQLAGFVERLLGRRGAGKHPATRVFQALRMEVNDETGELERALDGALAILAPGGRLAVITFESVTDGIVKRFFALHAGKAVSLQQGGSRWEGALPRVRRVTRKAVAATEAEARANPRARSAKLRVAEKTADEGEEEK